MPKKIIFAAIGAAILIVISAILSLNMARSADGSPFPEKINVYLTEHSKIASLDYREFLEGCLRGFLPENGDLYEPQTLEALAVIVNTNALCTLKMHGSFENFGADIATGELFPYVSYSDRAVSYAVRELVSAAAENSLNKFLAYDGEPVLLDFCRISTGKTTESLPVMPSVSLPSDVLAKSYQSSNAYTKSEILVMSDIKRPTESPEEWFTDAVYDEYQNLVSVKLLGKKLTGEYIQKTLGLRSTAIEITYDADCFRIICKGWGSNKGLSLNAADVMSREGCTASEILAVFYNAALKTVG